MDILIRNANLMLANEVTRGQFCADEKKIVMKNYAREKNLCAFNR